MRSQRVENWKCDGFDGSGLMSVLLDWWFWTVLPSKGPICLEFICVTRLNAIRDTVRIWCIDIIPIPVVVVNPHCKSQVTSKNGGLNEKVYYPSGNWPYLSSAWLTALFLLGKKDLTGQIAWKHKAYSNVHHISFFEKNQNEDERYSPRCMLHNIDVDTAQRLLCICSNESKT